MSALVFAAALVASFTNDLAIVDFDAKGRVASLRERATGRELVTNRVPAVYFRAGSKRVSAVSAVRAAEDSVVTFSFPGGGGELSLRFGSFGRGWSVEVVRCTLAADKFGSLVPLRLKPSCDAYDGAVLNMRSDDASGVVLRAYDESLGMSVDPEGLRVEVDNVKTPVGLRFGLVAGSRTELVGALRAMTVEAKAPVSSAGGAWSLSSDLNRASTLFADVSEESIDRWIDFARRGGFGILHFSRWWTNNGSYPVNTAYFPQGLDGLRRCAEKAQAAGLETGIHTLTACLSVKDDWVAEHLTDLAARCSYELAAPLDAGATDALCVVGPLKARHDTFIGYSSNGNALRIGGEIIQYAGVTRTPPHRFTGLRRGAFGTRPQAHPAGASVDYLRQRYLSFVPAAGTRLADRIATQVGSVFRACGHRDIYFDGAEALGQGPNLDLVRRQIFESLQSSPVVESSCGGAHGWWYRSRLGTWDHPRWAPKRFHDLHIRKLVDLRKANLMAVQSGWWKPHSATEVNRGHFLDEMEYFAGKNAAYDFATTIHGVPLQKGSLDPGVARQTELFGLYERFRRARAFSDDALKKLAVLGDEYRLRKDAAGSFVFRRSDAFVHRVTGLRDGTASWSATYPAVPDAFALRVEALAATGAPSNAPATLLSTEDAATVRTGSGVKARVAPARDTVHGAVLELTAENATREARGAWASAGFAFAPYRTMGSARAFGLWVRGDGKGELLNVQIASPREYSPALSEHYLRIDFSGWRRVTFLLRERDAETVERYGWPYSPMYAVYRNELDRRHVSGVNLYLNDIPAGGDCQVAVSAIEPLDVVRTTLTDVRLAVNATALRVPFPLTSGEYAELEDGVWTHYAESGAVRGRQMAHETGALIAGKNEVSFQADSSGPGEPRAEVTVFALGRPFPALKKGYSE